MWFISDKLQQPTLKIKDKKKNWIQTLNKNNQLKQSLSLVLDIRVKKDPKLNSYTSQIKTFMKSLQNIGF